MRYGIQDDIQDDIQDGFLEHVEMWLPDAAHGLSAGSDTNSRPFPLSTRLRLGERRDEAHGRM